MKYVAFAGAALAAVITAFVFPMDATFGGIMAASAATLAAGGMLEHA